MEDSSAAFRIFLTSTFLILAWARGATTLEDRLAVLGWICMILFEGVAAFLPKKTTGAIGENWKLDPSSILGFGPSSC
jgi:hypothetical protein